ncbi:hypothetical protein T07_2468 [Trichinella nelsoni]|uniref:Uncharacterized protein n=1 Tax=Trichinella nelsoni TaxID=6336 RepID=A0A0V0S7I0_9BILA|nr:hypothetical protein T07_2468 [Trichinella nelsoni]
MDVSQNSTRNRNVIEKHLTLYDTAVRKIHLFANDSSTLTNFVTLLYETEKNSIKLNENKLKLVFL